MYAKIFSTEFQRIFDSTPIEVGSAGVYKTGLIDISYFPSNTGNRDEVSVLLMSKSSIQPLLADLPWGLVTGNPEVVVEVGRTDRRGQFRTTVRPGKYKVRYVTGPETQLDSEILNRLQPVTLPPVPLWQVPLPLGASQYIGFASGDGTSLPAGSLWGLSGDNKDIVIDCEMKNVENDPFEFGVALVQYLAQDQSVLKSALIPVSANEKLQRFQGRLSVSTLVEDPVGCDPGRLVIWPINEQDLILKAITEKMIDDVLAMPFVRFSSDLKKRVEKLKQQINDSKKQTE